MKLLIAVDGSEISIRAAKFAIALAKRLASAPSITLVTVDPPLFPGADRKLGATAVARYHADNIERMLKPARKLFARNKLQVEERALVGDIADSLLETARKGGHDLIVMGSHGHGTVKGLFLGSVSAKVVAQSKIPVTIVR